MSSSAFHTGSEKIMGAIMDTGSGKSDDSPGLAGALMPLLERLGWTGDAREICETLPHFVDQIDLIDLRNIFVGLGFQSHPENISTSELDDRLLPCLFVSEDGQEVIPILRRTATGLEIWRRGTYQNVDLKEGQLGTAYYFTRAEQAAKDLHLLRLGWFGKALKQFKKSVAILLTVSFFTNILAVIFPLTIMFIYDRVIGAGSTETLPFILIGIVILLSSDLALRLIRSRLLGFVAGRLDYLLGSAAFSKILSLPPAFTERSAVSAQLARIKEFESLRDFFTGPLAMTVLELPFTLLIIGVIAFIAGWIALVPFLTIVGFLVLAVFMVPKAKELSRISSAKSALQEDLMVETLTKMRSIKDMGVEAIWQNRFRLATGQATSAQEEAENYNAKMDSIGHGLVMSSGLLVLALGALSVINGALTIGALIASMILTWRVLSPIQTSFLAYSKLDQISNSLKQLNALMRLESESFPFGSNLVSRDLRGDIVFNRVSFRYQNGGDPALLGTTFRIRQGQLVTIIGANSSGKSSILKLISGLYRPQGGSITMANVDLRQMDPVDLRQRIAYVPQKPDIFYGSIAQNLRLSNPLATNAELEQAARMTGLSEVIAELPEGFDTRVGLGQLQDLPPGFLQRLSLARAIVRNAPVIVLDEPGQSLDSSGDKILMDLLEALRGKTTVVMVSHRPSHIRMSDSVIVMNQGVVEYQGAPDVALDTAAALGKMSEAKNESR